MNTETLRMPEHSTEWELYRNTKFNCRGGREPGYAHVNPDGTLHCNRCGWTTPEPVVTSYSQDTGNVYLTWDELVEAEANGYVVMGTSSRRGTAAILVGPFPTKDDANRARARLRPKLVREERPHRVTTSVRILWKEAR